VTFDAPPTNVGCTRRDRSNSPLQALTLLNDPVFFEAAQAMAVNALTQADLTDKDLTDNERIEWIFRRAVSRVPTHSEMEVLREYLLEQRRLLSENSSAAERLAPLETDNVERAEVAAWTGLCSVVLNLHEFIVRE
jgi:hypothetical protein